MSWRSSSLYANDRKRLRDKLHLASGNCRTRYRNAKRDRRRGTAWLLEKVPFTAFLTESAQNP